MVVYNNTDESVGVAWRTTPNNAQVQWIHGANTAFPTPPDDVVELAQSAPLSDGVLGVVFVGNSWIAFVGPVFVQRCLDSGFYGVSNAVEMQELVQSDLPFPKLEFPKETVRDYLKRRTITQAATLVVKQLGPARMSLSVAAGAVAALVVVSWFRPNSPVSLQRFVRAVTPWSA